MADEKDYTEALEYDEEARAESGESNDPDDPNEEVAPNEDNDLDMTDAEEKAALRRALYGHDFPAAEDDDADDMQAWAS